MIVVILIAMAVAFCGGLIVGVVTTERYYSDLARLEQIQTLRRVVLAARRREMGQ